MGRSYTYIKNRALLKSRTRQTGAPCARCGGPFDWDAPWWFQKAYSTGHIVDIVDGGTDELENLQPEHHGCNTSAGAKKGIAIARAKGLPSNLAHQPGTTTTTYQPQSDPKSQEWP